MASVIHTRNTAKRFCAKAARCACTNCIASGNHFPPRIALPATTALYGDNSAISYMGRTSTCKPSSINIFAMASATLAVDPSRLA